MNRRARQAPCVACKGFEAECETPIGDGAAKLCWICAHHVTEHGASLEAGPARWAECGCSRAQIYPARVLARMNLLLGRTKAQINAA